MLMGALVTACAVPSLDERIARVEAGLEGPTAIAAEPAWKLAERMQHHRVPGVSVAVIDGFQPIWTKAYGVADSATGEHLVESTLLQAASIGKLVAAVAALESVERGKLDLTSSVNAALLSWRLPPSELTKDTPVTLRHLLSHTAGLTVGGFPGYPPGELLPSRQQILSGQPPARTPAVRSVAKPGEAVRYSGGGITVVEQLLSDRWSEPFPALVERLVFDPLQMKSSTYDQPPLSGRAVALAHDADGRSVEDGYHLYPELAAAGLWTTPGDLAKLVADLLRSSRGDADSLLDPATAAEMVRPVRDNAGLGVFLLATDGGPYLVYRGANRGFRAELAASLEHGYGAVVMTNADGGGPLAAELIRAIAREYDWRGYLRLPLKRKELSAERLDGFTGRYQLGVDRVLTVERQGSALFYRETFRDSPLELVPIGRERFAVREASELLEFVSEDGDQVMACRRGGMDYPRLSADRLPVELLEDGDTVQALAAYRALGIVDEARLNDVGYALLGADRTAQAVAVLTLNAELFPESANPYDSLADAWLAHGDIERAAEAYRQVVQRVPRDPRTDAASLAMLLRRAEWQLARLARNREGL